MKRLVIVALMAATTIVFVGCKKEETLGDKLGKAADQVEKSAKDTTKAAEKEAKAAEKKLDEAIKK